MFQEFQKYEKAASCNKFAGVTTFNGEPKTANEYYFQAKSEEAAAYDRKKRFQEFLNHRRDLLDAMTKSMIQECETEIVKATERAINADLQKMADKAVKFYFKIK